MTWLQKLFAILCIPSLVSGYLVNLISVGVTILITVTLILVYMHGHGIVKYPHLTWCSTEGDDETCNFRQDIERSHSIMSLVAVLAIAGAMLIATIWALLPGLIYSKIDDTFHNGETIEELTTRVHSKTLAVASATAPDEQIFIVHSTPTEQLNNSTETKMSRKVFFELNSILSASIGNANSVVATLLGILDLALLVFIVVFYFIERLHMAGPVSESEH